MEVDGVHKAKKARLSCCKGPNTRGRMKQGGGGGEGERMESRMVARGPWIVGCLATSSRGQNEICWCGCQTHIAWLRVQGGKEWE